MRIHRSAVHVLPALLAVLLSIGNTPAGASAQSGVRVNQEYLAGLALREIGPANMSGRVVDIAVVESDPVIFYVATATGGLWKTTSNGVTFDCVFEREEVHSIGAIALCQDNPDLIWLGSGERANRQSSGWGNGVYRSIDGGESWQNMGLHDSRHIGRVTIDPTNSDIVFVAAMGHLWGPNEERGLYRTDDGGRTWERILFIDIDTGVVDVAIDPGNPSIIYAATYQRQRRAYGFNGGGPGSGLWKSTDGGRNWVELTQGLPDGDKGRIGISIFRRDPRIVYVCVEQGWQYNASTAYGERRAGVYRSDDRGETWEHMSDWNPRPMYASQIYVDPNDDQRIYMQNSFSVSADGGRTFRSIRNSLHGDDRVVWVDPADSRHLIKGDDGGVGISWDRAETFLFVSSLPVSQFYRVGVDNAVPFNIYGGLQDNGSWYGPSATWRREGILNEDWIRTGGGDGFFNVPDPFDGRTLYTESQYLGLSRRDLITGESQSIRPGDPRGAIGARRNWDAWGPGIPEPELGNAMAPANWDGPIIISPHDPNTIFAGTNILWRSADQGRTWDSLGDLTTGVDRRELTIMRERADDATLSLDDGIPYYPTLTSIEESPLVRGLLYVGSDDGSVQVSSDDGTNWTSVIDRFPGLPAPRWVADIEASHFSADTVYLAFDGHRSDDNANYLYRSSDRGMTWQSITGDLPPELVVRTVHEDPRNPAVLWIGTEFGCFVSIDGGNRWIELQNNLPTVAVNDLLVHPRDNDLVLGTHSRGIWILDNVNAIQELKPDVIASRSHLFTIEPAMMIRIAGEKAHTGDMIFRGENPPVGAIIDFWIASDDGGGSESRHIR
ncbi:WD40/YVTN/BNR-like repeat-containing protein [Candidatus Zixiibacteriota bacterium]